MVHKRLTDAEGKIRKEIQEQWRVFAVCNPKKEFAFEEDTAILVQVRLSSDHGEGERN